MDKKVVCRVALKNVGKRLQNLRFCHTYWRESAPADEMSLLYTLFAVFDVTAQDPSTGNS